MKIRHIGPRAAGTLPDGIKWRRGEPVDVPDELAKAMLAGGHEVGTGQAVSPEWETVPEPGPKPTESDKE